MRYNKRRALHLLEIKQMSKRNEELSQHMAGLGILMEAKNVALVDISDYIQKEIDE